MKMTCTIFVGGPETKNGVESEVHSIYLLILQLVGKGPPRAQDSHYPRIKVVKKKKRRTFWHSVLKFLYAFATLDIGRTFLKI